MKTVFADITDRMDLAASRIAVRNDRPVAAAFVIPERRRLLDPHLWPVAATIPHRTGRHLLLVKAP